MKKNECINCQNGLIKRCYICDGEHEDSARTAFHPTLYAAEFLLYAFHFSDHDARPVEKAPAHPLRILVAEG